MALPDPWLPAQRGPTTRTEASETAVAFSFRSPASARQSNRERSGSKGQAPFLGLRPALHNGSSPKQEVEDCGLALAHADRVWRVLRPFRGVTHRRKELSSRWALAPPCKTDSAGEWEQCQREESRQPRQAVLPEELLAAPTTGRAGVLPGQVRRLLRPAYRRVRWTGSVVRRSQVAKTFMDRVVIITIRPGQVLSQ